MFPLDCNMLKIRFFLITLFYLRFNYPFFRCRV